MRFLQIAMGLALIASAAIAEGSPLAPGARVRVTLLEREAPRVVGPMLALPADSLVVAAEPDSLARSIARLDVRKLEVSRGMKSNARRGATIGALLLGVVFCGSVWSAASVDGPNEDAALAGIGGFAVGALAGAGLGALIGSASKHEQWEDVLVERRETAR